MIVGWIALACLAVAAVLLIAAIADERYKARRRESMRELDRKRL